ncbi:hypothetical protein [Flavobacterium sp. ov086]|uniref:hypothetical protein n=1 Tax=Flavobacterium sp. ov086 TaxID=1761785 RepID=UPI000B6A9BC1|nr:hypothetical protein [Flavobacterium sp. ov086]SNR92226.1 hypothetical protein SAMN04487979_1315 [Flavobacterium sp. ov086]
MKKYELYWKNNNIGSLIETNWEMRSYGDILFNPAFLIETSENRRLLNLIENSVKASKYLDEGDDDNYDKMCEEANDFLDLINSPDWYVINDKSEIVKILCPMFHENNEITWQNK